MNNQETHLSLSNLSKNYGSVRAVNNLSLNITRGECLALLGPSGCGKSTILKLIAGLELPNTGQMVLANRDITKSSPETRNLGFVFQNYALFPHLSVGENVAFGLKARGKSKSVIDEKVNSSLELVQLKGLANRRIHELSGGQQQRVAIARALAIEPELLLLDEPLSNLDVALRTQTGQQLRELIKRLNISTIFVTHDQADAFALADRIALINEGQLQQVGNAMEIYFQPKNLFVASFIGHSNLLQARLVKAISEELAEYKISQELSLSAPKVENTGEVTLRIRPEAIEMLKDQQTNSLPAKILNVRFSGTTIHYYLRVQDIDLEVVRLTPQTPLDINFLNECWVKIPPNAITVFS
ncbi:MAG: ABC transporter ATP-binding protein [Acidobacteria bacterium]|nr:ABC transporter ATP-binding protein [Acidobacteriota bacterium]